MTNWLESGEKRKAVEDERIALAKQSKLHLAEIQSKKVESLLVILKPFFELCYRTKNAVENQLSIHDNTLFTVTLHVGIAKEVKTSSIYRTQSFVRQILFSVTDNDDIRIEAKQYTKINHHLNDSEKPVYRILYEKLCTTQEIINWHEEKMLNIISWLISKSEFSRNNLPGIEECGTNVNNKLNWLERLFNI